MTSKNKPANSCMIDVNDSVLLLIDHQTGLFQTVKDLTQEELRGNVVALARLAKITGLQPPSI